MIHKKYQIVSLKPCKVKPNEKNLSKEKLNGKNLSKEKGV
jgi:hypothetical protein